MIRLPKLWKREIFEAYFLRQRFQPNSSRQWHQESSGVQEVCVVDIDPEKLIEKLRLKFPAGFNVHVGITQIAPRLRSLISSYR
jgi:hypothetical protein